MRSVADELRDATRRWTAALSPDARVHLALDLGDADVRALCEARGLSVEEAKATEPDPLSIRVVDILDRSRVPCALIGAAALAVHGISRSTVDLDLLVTDRRVLDPSLLGRAL